MNIIAPSILSADFLNLKREVEIVNKSQAQWLHCDVMDGAFVPNISFGIPVIRSIKNATNKLIDVHLMIEKPERYITQFKEAGANAISIHYEATKHVDRTLQQIKQHNLLAGLALNPATPINVVENVLYLLDYILIMSVNPGFGGQKFIENSYKKIASLKKMLSILGYENILIEVDGGVNLTNAKKIVSAGANILVAGSAIFKSDNPLETINKMNSAINNYVV